MRTGVKLITTLSPAAGDGAPSGYSALLFRNAEGQYPSLLFRNAQGSYQSMVFKKEAVS